MQNIMFIDKSHLDFYTYTAERIKEARKIKDLDVYQKALVYSLGLLADCRTHFNDLFSISRNEIRPDALSAGWQTSGSTAITLFAFNLWNDFFPGNAPELVSISSLFSQIPHLTPYLFEAIKLRFPANNEQMYDVLGDNDVIAFSRVPYNTAKALEKLAPGQSITPSRDFFLNI